MVDPDTYCANCGHELREHAIPVVSPDGGQVIGYALGACRERAMRYQDDCACWLFQFPKGDAGA